VESQATPIVNINGSTGSSTIIGAAGVFQAIVTRNLPGHTVAGSPNPTQLTVTRFIPLGGAGGIAQPAILIVTTLAVAGPIGTATATITLIGGAVTGIDHHGDIATITLTKL
jgi:hypothetical protein